MRNWMMMTTDDDKTQHKLENDDIEFVFSVFVFFFKVIVLEE